MLNTFLNKKNTFGMILAAGMGKRMANNLPKVAHTILGKPMIIWCLENLMHAGITNIVVVLSPQQTLVKEIIEKYLETTPPTSELTIQLAYQAEAQGTGHAVQCGLHAVHNIIKQKSMSHQNNQLVVAFGDTPAISSKTLHDYSEFHEKNKNAFTIMAFYAKNPSGYGRILKDASENFFCIREEKDCSSTELSVHLCNSGLLYGELSEFEFFLPQIKNNNANKEYYLTDVPLFAKNNNKKIGIFDKADEEELAGVNSQLQLAEIAKFLQKRIIHRWMANGVQFLNPDAVYLEDGVTLKNGLIVEPFVYLSGNCNFQSEDRIISGTRR